MLVAIACNILNARQRESFIIGAFRLQSLESENCTRKEQCLVPFSDLPVLETDHSELLLRVARHLQSSNSCLLKATLCMLPGKPRPAYSAQAWFTVSCTCSSCTYVG